MTFDTGADALLQRHKQIADAWFAAWRQAQAERWTAVQRSRGVITTTDKTDEI